MAAGAPPGTAPPASAARLFGDCLLLGLTAWGGFMALLAQAQDRFVKQRQWLAEKDFLDLIALVSMLPGPQAVNALAVMGHRLAGWPGFAAALAGIVMPSFFVVLALWFGYSQLAGHAGWLRALTLGVLPPLAAILGQAAVNQARKAAPARRQQVLAVASALLLLLIPYWAAPLYLLAGGAAVSLLFWPAPPQVEAGTMRRLSPLGWLLCFGPVALAVFQFVPALLPSQPVPRLGLAFAGIGTTLFGGALVMVPLLEGLIVDHLGWLSHAGFGAGLAASQLTPGPILGIATFTGMQVAGWAGALSATIGIYAPTALIAVGVDQAAERLRASRRFQHAMAGVRCVVVGLIGGAAVSLLIKLPWLQHPAPLALLLAAAWLLVWRWRQPPYVSLPVGVALAWLLL